MSSSQPFASSPFSTAGSRRKSKFTHRHLHHLAASSSQSPLRVIAHIDLDAFYAQCEQIRLGLPEDTPLAVQQWQGLIAINYPAREFGLTRHVTVAEAREKCPQIVLQHVATWREGDDRWAYRDDAASNIKTDKVSLDPFRACSRQILALIKTVLTKESPPRVEKAGIDEVFVDLSAPVHALLLERYPQQLTGPPPYDDPSSPLPAPPTTVLDWHSDALVDLDVTETEDDDPDWDDVCMQLGSEIVREVRTVIRKDLKFTCSAGIARNKLLAKLGSAHKKPNSQTVIRNRAVGTFLEPKKFTKIRMLGGKLGDEAVAAFHTDKVSELLEVPLAQLQAKLGPETGNWLFGAIRGEDLSEVSTRTALKSMLSAKSFRPVINDFETATRWLRIFAADIYARCVEEGVVEHRRRPRTITLHHRQGAQSRSRQLPIPTGKTPDETTLFELAKTLMAQVVVDGRAWPCANLSLSVGGWEDNVQGNRSIGNFLVRGEQAKAMLEGERTKSERDLPDLGDGPPEKKRKIGHGGIAKFLAREDSRNSPSGHDDEDAMDDASVASAESQENHAPDGEGSKAATERRQHTPAMNAYSDSPPPSAQRQPSSPPPRDVTSRFHQSDISTFFCSGCKVALPEASRCEHEDWHYAKDLEEQLRAEQAEQAQPVQQATHAAPSKPIPASTGMPRGRGRPPGRGKSRGGEERGQKKLAFG